MCRRAVDRTVTGPGVQVRRLTVGPVAANCYLARSPGSATAVVVDPGAEADRILSALEAWDAGVDAILLTHGHMDHVGAVAELNDRTGAPVHLHPADRDLYDRAAEHAATYGLRLPDPPPPDHELAHGQSLRAGGLAWGVRHAPGHSPGGVVLTAGGDAFVGDCVFQGSVGRVDLPGGDGETLLTSIRKQILTLPDDTTLWPGHGPETTVAREAASNPFLDGSFGFGR